MVNDTIILDTPEEISFYRFAMLKSALKLEIAGIRPWYHTTAYAVIKRSYGLKGSRVKVLGQMEKMVEDAIKARE